MRKTSRLWKMSFIFILSIPAHADVTVTRRLQTEGIFGISSLVDSVAWRSGDKEREEIKDSSETGEKEVHEGPKITRLDKKVLWKLDPLKKSYEEVSLGSLKKADPKTANQARDPSIADGRTPTNKILRAEFVVKPLGQKKTINGFACEGFETFAEVETQNLENHERSRVTLRIIDWNTPATGQVAELKKAEERYVETWKKMSGVDADSGQAMKTLVVTMMASMTGAEGGDLEKAFAHVPEEMKKVQGYPILPKSEWFSRRTEEKRRPDAGSAEKPGDSEHSTRKSFASLYGDWTEANPPQKSEKPSGDGNDDASLIISTTNELKSISLAPIPAATFEIPAGFQKATPPSSPQFPLSIP